MRTKNIKIIGVIITFLLIFSLVSCSGSKDNKQINLMTWGGDFIPRKILDQFYEETGIKVNYKEVPSNEEMQSLLESNPDQYDLAVVTDYMVDILRQNNNLNKLDKKSLPNYSNLNPLYLGNYYDENDEFSIPYAVSTSFLLVNHEAVKARCKTYYRL